MNRRFTALLIAAFLGVQMLSFLHLVEHGFEPHEHDGHICQTYLYCEQVQYGAPDAARLQTPVYFVTALARPAFSFASRKHYRSAPPRAPPLFT